MNTINSSSNSYKVYTQSNAQVSNSQGQPRIHHHHKKIESQDSSQFSQEGLQSLSNSIEGASSTAPKSPLASLVANGTITQDQDDAIKSAFQSARQANMTGTYGSKPTNPINDLVANGTITEDQANAIKGSLKAMAPSNEEVQQVSGSQGQSKIHRHHHHGQQSQSVVNASQTISQSADTSTESSSSSS